MLVAAEGLGPDPLGFVEERGTVQQQWLAKNGLQEKNTFLEFSADIAAQVSAQLSEAGSDPTTTNNSSCSSADGGRASRPPPALPRSANKKVWYEFSQSYSREGSKSTPFTRPSAGTDEVDGSSRSSTAFHRAAEAQAKRCVEAILADSEGDNSRGANNVNGGVDNGKHQHQDTLRQLEQTWGNRQAPLGGGAGAGAGAAAAGGAGGGYPRQPLQPGLVQVDMPSLENSSLNMPMQPLLNHPDVSFHTTLEAAREELGAEAFDRLRLRVVAKNQDMHQVIQSIPLGPDGRMTSVGSAGHFDNSCKPCAFAVASLAGSSKSSTSPPEESQENHLTLRACAEKVGCLEGYLCRYCHFPHNVASKMRLRPCKGKRERYRKLVNRRAQEEDQEGGGEGENDQHVRGGSADSREPRQDRQSVRSNPMCRSLDDNDERFGNGAARAGRSKERQPTVTRLSL